ncbi:helix-turn-helix transcriptional regulator [Candidatus Dojkabacteria bacterium]|nr:helix-turn-helix transcriptional regulator [Candidatus Dojkabacteria bacterium]
MANNYEKLGSAIRKIRKQNDLSQEDLAEKVGVDARTIVAIETGKRNPTLKTMNKISKALKVSLSQLLNF